LRRNWAIIGGMAAFFALLFLIGTILNRGVTLRTVLESAFAGVIAGGAVLVLRRPNRDRQ